MWVCVTALVCEAAAWLLSWYVDVEWVPLAVPLLWTSAAVAWNLWANRSSATATTVCVMAGAWLVAAVAVSAWIDVDVAIALVVSASAEEVVYRVAIPAVIVVALRAAGVGATPAFITAAAVATVIFAHLPGHLAQSSGGLLGGLPWAAMSAMWFWMLWRGLPLVVPVLCHAAFNMGAAALAGGAPLWTRQAALIGVVAAFVAAEMWRDRAVTQVPAT
jgi:hypothetical protein